MGYYTDLSGEFDVTPPLKEDDAQWIESRCRKEFLRNEPDTPNAGYLMWTPSVDRTAIRWDGAEGPREYVEWLQWLIDAHLAPLGYALNGDVTWDGSESGDLGLIEVRNNVVNVRPGTIVYEGQEGSLSTVPSSRLAETADSVAGQMNEWAKELEPLLQTGANLQDLYKWCRGLRAAFEGIAGDLHRAIEQHEKQEAATSEPHTIICWTDGAVVHDVEHIPPGVRVVFRDLDTEGAGDDYEIRRHPEMGEYVEFEPYEFADGRDVRNC